MARSQTLSTIRARLKAELRDAQETNTTLDTEYNYALDQMQKTLANAYDWPFLNNRWEVSTAAGSRYLAFPISNIRGTSATINFERPVQLWVKWNSLYKPVDKGIGQMEYNAVAEGTRQDPVQRWRIDTNTGEASNPNEFEIWPTAASVQVLRFEGQRNVGALSSDSDKADLDDLLLVYMVAADYLLQRQQSNAPLMRDKAAAHLLKLRAGYPSRNDRLILGGEDQPERRTVKLIATA